MSAPDPNRARGQLSNPKNRFLPFEVVVDDYCDPGEPRRVKTEFLRDDTQTIITRNQSPDVGFETSLNPYRGCEHGCAYCFARPTHEYLGFSAGLDFESKIVVKPRAPELLRAELLSRKWRPQTLVMSGVTDCYQPIERRLELTRGCLKVLAEFRNPVAIITKNHLVTRDIDLLGELAGFSAAAVNLSITSLDGELAKVLEPRASPPARRLAAVRELSEAGIPVRVMFAPVIPGLNDHEMPQLLAAAAEAGAKSAGYVLLRLPWAVAPLWEEWLERHRPGFRDKIMSRIRDARGGKRYDARWGKRQTGEGVWAEQIASMFEIASRKAGLDQPLPPLSLEHFRRPGAQMTLWETLKC
jgi:DNA repair photolyase